ncbi:MAG: hypothetical protein C4309_02670, partial [Chloroflexota bacterium]
MFSPACSSALTPTRRASPPGILPVWRLSLMSSDETPRLGFIGLGLMGRPMAHNLLKAGFPLTVYSRSPAPVEELVTAGAHAAHSPGEVAAAADVVITMLPDAPDVEAALFGPNGVMEAARPGLIVIDMSTVSP